MVWLAVALTKRRRLLAAAIAKQRAERVRRWRDALPAIWESRSGVIYRWLRDETPFWGSVPIVGPSGLQCSSVKEGLRADVGDQVEAVLAPFGNQRCQPGRASYLMVGGGTDYFPGLEGGQFQGDHLAADSFSDLRSLLGRLVEVVAEAGGDSQVLAGRLPIVVPLMEQGDDLQRVVFFRP